MAAPLAEFVVSLNTDGYIVSQGSVTDALAKDLSLAEEMKHEEEAVELEENEDTATKPAEEQKGALVVTEEIAIGRVSWKAGGHLVCLRDVIMHAYLFLQSNCSLAVWVVNGLYCGGYSTWASPV